MESSTEKRLEQKAGLNFRSDVIALDLLCSPATTSVLETRVEALDLGDQRNFLRGYRLAVATPLVGMLRFSVVRPELLGFEFDERVSNWLNYRSPQSVEPLISAVSDPDSDLGILCHIFNDLQLGLRRSESGLPDTFAVIEKCRTFAHEFGECFLSTELVRFDGSASQLGDGELLQLCVAERVLDYVEYDPSAVAMAHELIWGHGEEWPIVHDHFVLEAETHLTAIPRNFLGTGIPSGFRDGLLFGFDSIIRRIGISLPSDRCAEPFAAPAWFDELLAVVNPNGPDGLWPSQMCGLAEFSSLDTSGLAQRLGATRQRNIVRQGFGCTGKDLPNHFGQCLMMFKIAVASIIALSALLAIGVVSANPETTDEWAGFDGESIVVGVLRTPTPTYAATPTRTPEPTATHTYTPTASPTPTPVSVAYVEPEFARLASLAAKKVWNQADADALCEMHQRDVWGRCLWGDETHSLRIAVAKWTTVDFDARCLSERHEYAPATEHVRERYPKATFVRDSSHPHFGLESGPLGGEWANYFYATRLNEEREITSIYRAILPDGDIQWLRTVSLLRFYDCSVVRITPIRMSECRGLCTAHHFTFLSDPWSDPLQESEVGHGHSIRCRIRSCR